MGDRFDDLSPVSSDLRAALAGAACLGAWSFEPYGGRLVLARRFANLLGLSEHPMPVPLPLVLSRVHPGDRIRVESVLHAAIETGESFEAEFRTDGAARGRRLRVMGRAEPPGRGHRSFVRGLAFDLTENPRSTTSAEQAQHRANKLAEHVIAIHGLVACLHNPVLAERFEQFEKAVGREIARHLRAAESTRLH